MALRYKVTLPPPGAADVVTRKVHIEQNGVDAVSDLPVAQVDSEFLVEQGTTVAVWLVDVDDAGNASPASPRTEFVAADTIPPPAPHAPAVQLLGEE